MAYCSTTDLDAVLSESDLVQLTDDEGTGSIDTDRAQAAIDRAAVLIDGYVGVVATLPLALTPPILAALNTDLAICELFARVPTGLPETWKDRQERALDLLKEMAAGKMALTPHQDQGQGPAAVRTSVRTRIFTPAELGKF